MSNNSWENLVAVVSLNNKGKPSEAIKLALTLNLSVDVRLFCAVIDIFTITPEFMTHHINEATALINLGDSLGKHLNLRTSLRLSALRTTYYSMVMRKGDLW